jgi:beta-glucosidase
MLAQTWNVELIEQVGKAIGEEMVEYAVTLWLAPGMNIHRDPLNGRNFEYYSEDPLISGMTATATTSGVQSNAGVGVTLKHYAGNNQETSRDMSNDTISERALREIYLKGFEIAVKSAQPMAVMSSYNKINGTYVAGDYDLLTDVLRGEWDFKGLVMTDWGGVRAGIVDCMYAGNDLIEPGGAPVDVINATRVNPPTLDVFGLPAYTTMSWFGQTTYSWQAGNLALSATGAEAETKVVNQTNFSGQPLSGETVFDMATFTVTVVPLAPFGSVQEAYDFVLDLLADPDVGLTPAQKAGITVTVTDSDLATGEVLAYEVELKGDYRTNMRLGDLQRSATRILDIVMQSADFAALAEAEGVSGVSVAPYLNQFPALASYVGATRGEVVAPQEGPEPTPTPSPSPSDGSGGGNGGGTGGGKLPLTGTNAAGPAVLGALLLGLAGAAALAARRRRVGGAA